MNSNNIAIKVENISKCYRIGLKENRAKNFGDAILEFIRRPLQNYRRYRSLYKFDDINNDYINNSENNPPDIIWA